MPPTQPSASEPPRSRRQQRVATSSFSTQVLTEFYPVVTRQLVVPVPPEDAEAIVGTLSALPVMAIDSSLVGDRREPDAAGMQFTGARTSFASDVRLTEPIGASEGQERLMARSGPVAQPDPSPPSAADAERAREADPVRPVGPGRA
jgi:hypothetical protein